MHSRNDEKLLRFAFVIAVAHLPLQFDQKVRRIMKPGQGLRTNGFDILM